ncbi:unnamed protein product, partial [marine sediment metagenome]
MSNSKDGGDGKIIFTDDVIKSRLGKYGAVYFPFDIQESIDDILGNENIKEIL